MQKKHRKSIENSNVKFISKTNDETTLEEQHGMKKPWDRLNKEVWNKHLMVPKDAVIDMPVPLVNLICRRHGT